MNRVATLSILLAMAVTLLPCQICDCGDDGPHLKPLWASADCHPADAPTPSDRSDEPEHACGDLFQVEGVAARAAPALPAPGEGDACASLAAVRAVCTALPTAREPVLGAQPPSETRPASPLCLATRLLL